MRRRVGNGVYVTYDPPLPTRCETARARRIERHLLKRGQPGPRLRLGLTGTAALGPYQWLECQKAVLRAFEADVRWATSRFVGE